jgi:hypothetical protein
LFLHSRRSCGQSEQNAHNIVATRVNNSDSNALVHSIGHVNDRQIVASDSIAISIRRQIIDGQRRIFNIENVHFQSAAKSLISKFIVISHIDSTGNDIIETSNIDFVKQ